MAHSSIGTAIRNGSVNLGVVHLEDGFYLIGYWKEEDGSESQERFVTRYKTEALAKEAGERRFGKKATRRRKLMAA